MSVAVILAAGSSTRMGKGLKKEYMTFQGRPLLHHCVETFSKSGLFERIVIVCRKDYLTTTHEILSDLDSLDFIPGGNTRQESVFKALSYLHDSSPDYILIHDGARPFVSHKTIEAVIEKTKEKSASIPVEPATNTMKVIDEEGKILTHLNRSVTKGAQTPQGFLFSLLYEAHRKAKKEGEQFTDDSEIWDRFCGPVYTVEGNLENDKITYQSDLTSLGIELEGIKS
jgi:2-C-methyl-D-erythritol 4-phosphate cytidylyltransferase